MLCLAKVVFVLVGVGFSVFYACKAVDVFTDTNSEFIKTKMKLASWRFHQYWLNFVGSLTGWAAAYYFVFCRLHPLSSFSLKIEDTVVILIAVLGITGLLPYTLSKLSSLK